MHRSDVLAILDSGDFAGLVGAEEQDDLEFKRSPYRLDAPGEVFELAKDVSGLANARGGLLLIGFETQTRPDTNSDVVMRVREFEGGLASPQRYIDKLHRNVHPAIDGLRVLWKPTAADSTRGVLLIDVPPQEDDQKYFLISEPFGASGGTPGYLVGIAVRRGSQVRALGVEQLRLLIRDGRNLGARLASLEQGLIDQGSAGTGSGDVVSLDQSDSGAGFAATVEPEPSHALATHVREVTTEALDSTAPWLVLAACPSQPNNVPTIFRTEGVRQLLEDPPFTRPDGWNLVTLDQARIVGGNYLFLANGERKLLFLFRDGTFVAAGTMDPDFLGWRGNSMPWEQAPKLNALAIIEFIHDFVLVYNRILEWFENTPSTVVFEVSILNALVAAGEPLFLPAGTVKSLDYQFATSTDADRHLAPADAFERLTEISTSDGQLDVQTAAWRLVSELYAWFGHAVDRIPYTVDEGIRPDLFT